MRRAPLPTLSIALGLAITLGTALACSDSGRGESGTGGEEVNDSPTSESPDQGESADSMMSDGSEGPADTSTSTTDPSDTSTTDPSDTGTTTDTGGECGNGTIDDGEQCDGGNLGGFSCTDLGYSGGTLACDPVTCTYDASGCTTDTTTQGGTSG